MSTESQSPMNSSLESVDPHPPLFEMGPFPVDTSAGVDLQSFLGKGSTPGRPFIVETRFGTQIGHGKYLEVSATRVEVDGEVTIIKKFSGKGGLELREGNKARVWFRDQVDSNATYKVMKDWSGEYLQCEFSLYGLNLRLKFARDGRYPNSAWLVPHWKVDLGQFWLTNK